MSIKFITNEELYKQAIEPVARATSFVWIGASANTRNFESVFVTTDPEIVEAIMNQFYDVWMGKHCKSCKRKEFCSDPIL